MDRLRRRTSRDLREERDELGFVRQPEVRWMSPGLLAKSGVEVAVSGAFGKFADKREIQREPQDGLDYSAAGELWVDYLSDTGDGWDATYTMAWLLAQESLDFDDEQLPRAKVLLLGGDQVYPSADPVAYEDRFIGPFAAALPKTDAPDKPDLYALPGHHDWYDGLVSFLRVFCARDGRVGDWVTRQRRSYFALKLPHDWWVWGIDIQLDTYIDDVQLDYFRSQKVQQDDKIILLTAKPSWVKASPGWVEPASWRYLSFFEERFVRARGARLVLTLTGDQHHYARYEPAGEGARNEPTRITAGGGGAYLSPTHTLKPELALRSLDHDDSVRYTRDEIYPCARDSRRLSNGILKLACLNPSFARLIGAIYVLLGIAMLSALNAGERSLVDNATREGFFGFLASASGGMSIFLMILLFCGFFAGADIKPQPLESSGAARLALGVAKFGVALAQTLVHILLAAACRVGGPEARARHLGRGDRRLDRQPASAVRRRVGGRRDGVRDLPLHRPQAARLECACERQPGLQRAVHRRLQEHAADALPPGREPHDLPARRRSRRARLAAARRGRRRAALRPWRRAADGAPDRRAAALRRHGPSHKLSPLRAPCIPA